MSDPEYKGDIDNPTPFLALITSDKAALFWSRITITDTGCFEFNAPPNDSGYCKFRVTQQPTNIIAYAHRIAWCLYNQTDTDYTVHHRCFNRKCVNPLHLETKTVSQNCAERRNTSLVDVKTLPLLNDVPF